MSLTSGGTVVARLRLLWKGFWLLAGKERKTKRAQWKPETCIPTDAEAHSCWNREAKSCLEPFASFPLWTERWSEGLMQKPEKLMEAQNVFAFIMKRFECRSHVKLTGLLSLCLALKDLSFSVLSYCGQQQELWKKNHVTKRNWWCKMYFFNSCPWHRLPNFL